MNNQKNRLQKKNPNDKWLIISHAFNMDGRAASQTLTDKIPFLIDRGITPIIVSGVLGNRDTLIEHHRLFPVGPAGLRFDLRHLIRRRWPSVTAYKLLLGLISLALLPFIVIERLLFGLSNQASWSLSAFFKARALIRDRKLSYVYTTGGAYSAHLCGYWLKKLYGNQIEWLAEIHDPLVSTTEPIRSRDAKFQANLEKRIAENADLIWWFTDGALRSALTRHPKMYGKAFAFIPGATPLAGQPVAVTNLSPTLRFGHFGSLTESRSLTPFLKGISLFLNARPEYWKHLEVHLYGGKTDSRTRDTVRKLNLQSLVFEHGRTEQSGTTGESGRSQILKVMKQMDCLLIPHGEGPECQEYIPSKLYDYLWANRPILVTSAGNQQFKQMIRLRRGWFVDNQDLETLVGILEEITRLKNNNTLASNWRFNPISSESCVDQILAAL